MFGALLLVSLSPMQCLTFVSFHPIAWSLALVSLGVWLGGTGRSAWRNAASFLLLLAACGLRIDALLLAPVLIERMIGRSRAVRAVWLASLVLPLFGLVISYGMGDVFVRKFWNLSRLGGFPGQFVDAVGLAGALGIVVLLILVKAATSVSYWRVVLSWSIPTLLFWGANPTPPRHLWFLLYAAAFAVFLEPVLAVDIKGRFRRSLVLGAVGLACVAQALLGGASFWSACGLLRSGPSITIGFSRRTAMRAS